MGTPYLTINPSKKLSQRSTPYATLITALIAALKLLYGLDGRSSQQPVLHNKNNNNRDNDDDYGNEDNDDKNDTASPPGVPLLFGSWQDWSLVVYQRLPPLTTMPLTTVEVCASIALSDQSGSSQYAEHGTDVVPHANNVISKDKWMLCVYGCG